MITNDKVENLNVSVPGTGSETPGADFFTVDWNHPVFFGLVQLLPEVLTLTSLPDLVFFNDLAKRRGLTLPDGRAVTFVHQPKRPSRWRRRKTRKPRYEQSVLEDAVIPSRLGSWHDFFNNLSWLLFSRAKMALVQRLAAAALNKTTYDIERGQFRSREGDRLAMLDEGGVLRINCGKVYKEVVFGHALQESFMQGQLNVWSLTVPLPVPYGPPAELLPRLDESLATLITSGFFAEENPEFDSTCLRDLAGC